jgi:hypothetical protein
MGDLSKHFSRSEFACPCECGRDAVDYTLIRELESLAVYFEDENPSAERVAVHINSGNRCAAYDLEMKLRDNIPVKVKASEHIFNWAADFRMEWVYPDGSREKIPDDDIADVLELWHEGEHGIGRYNGRTHYDTRTSGPARWDNRA